MNTTVEKDILSKDEETASESALLETRIITGIKTTTFKIISKDVREFHFIIPFDNRVELGEIFLSRTMLSKKMKLLSLQELPIFDTIQTMKENGTLPLKGQNSLTKTKFLIELSQSHLDA